jgi:alkane 1-monooxygenase
MQPHSAPPCARTAPKSGKLWQALPFWLSLCAPIVMVIAAMGGGWTLILPPLCAWGLFTLLDALLGQNQDNPDPNTPDSALFWHSAITLIWFPIQAALLVWMLAYVPQAAHLGTGEKLAAFFGMGVFSGTIGIVYAHELMHQKNKTERWLADLLLAIVLYSHFRSHHLRVHHIHVATPKDDVTARYNEGFHRFFPRVLRGGLRGAWAGEADMLSRRGLPVWHKTNPFWRYGALQLAALIGAFALGGALGVALFAVQALVAIWQLELTNYIEHYGLTRRHLGNGKYEPVRPHHSWNAAHRATNWLLINLQRHSDHHYKPDRRYPLLQTYGQDQAPALPFGYPLMGIIAMIPPLWRRMMNPRVRNWRRQFYPDITDWHAYNKGLNPVDCLPSHNS